MYDYNVYIIMELDLNYCQLISPFYASIRLKVGAI